MSGMRGQEEDDRVADDAAHWFVRLQSETATEHDWLAFEVWLAASPAHAEAYDRLERLWVALEADRPDMGQALSPRAIRAAGGRRLRPQGRGTSRRAWIAGAGAIAAGLLVAVEIANRPGAPQSLELRAGPGETKRFVLADGTRINLNSGSVLKVAMGRDQRRVTMPEGEAVFDVAHDARRPFLIIAGDREVRVVGTMFNLRQRDGQMALTVRRGVVEVRPADQPDAPASRVSVGQQLAYRDGKTTVTQDELSDAAFAWTNGQLIYRNQPLADVAADLTRRFGTPVRPADASTGALKFSGVLVLDNEPAVLSRIEAFVPVKAVRTPQGVVLERR